MKRVLILTAVLMLLISCANQADSVKTTTREVSTPASVASASPNANQVEEKREIPSEFKNIDFENRAYPVHRTNVRLKDGKYEYSKGIGGTTFELGDVDYVDLNQDGRKEAVVQISQLTCGGSCDGGTDLFYFYSIKRGRLSMLTKLEIGSYAYDCGLKVFTLKKQTLLIQTFRTCRFTGSAFKPIHDDPNEEGGKLSTNRYTQFSLYFKGRGFVQSQRKVFSYPDVYDFRGHERKVEISDK